MNNKLKCFACGKELLSKDEVGVNQKMLGRSVKKLYCFDCFSEYLGVTKAELLEKIEEFKEQGCDLF